MPIVAINVSNGAKVPEVNKIECVPNDSKKCIAIAALKHQKMNILLFILF